MENIKIEPFSIIGLSIRTTNENNKSAEDIGALWNRFLAESISKKIPNKTSNDIYSIYTEYESDYTKPYTVLLGCKVDSLDEIPAGLNGMTFSGGEYSKFTAKGNLQEGIVYQEWVKIWNSDVDRAYTADFEIYGEKAQNPENAEVDIFIAIK
jgi:predicted transcriptional regulator YdeE